MLSKSEHQAFAHNLWLSKKESMPISKPRCQIFVLKGKNHRGRIKVISDICLLLHPAQKSHFKAHEPHNYHNIAIIRAAEKFDNMIGKRNISCCLCS